MKRIIVDYKKLTPEILAMLVEKYPDGYDDIHIISFKNAKNETIEAVEVRTEDTIYLVKVSQKLETSMANFEDEFEDDDDFNDDEPMVDIPEDALIDEDMDDDDE